MRTSVNSTRIVLFAKAPRLSILVLFLVVLEALCSVVMASDTSIVIPTRQQAIRVNADTIGVVFTHEELFHQLVHDMEDALEPVSGLRIVPVMGKNHVQSIYDLLYLKGVDLALVRSDAVEYVRRKGDYDRIEQFVNSVAKLTDERIVLIARKSVVSVDDLAGETIAFGVPGSGEYVTGTIAFDTMGIPVKAVEMEGTQALKQVRDGKIAAMVYLLRAEDSIQTGSDLQTARSVAQIDESEDLHVIPIPISDALSDIYHPTELEHEDLPGLIPRGTTVQSYLVDVILAGYQWRPDNPRYDKSVRFVNALLDSLSSLRSGDFQPGWEAVSLTQSNPTIEPLPVVGRILSDRDRLAVEATEKRADELKQAALEQRNRRAVELIATRDRLSALLEQKLDDSDTRELENLLEELDSILGTTDAE